MFKIESYVTPILLSYVDKYVRDFKPADAQVSLWGGGVALHNLVLKADVLQKEIALPFTLVSGRIHELLIQVPWTKIMSEPIVVTIDTIECVLSIHPPAPDDNVPPESPSRKVAAVEAPPGYMQALVRRVVSNISLRVHHLIVKYVQDDVVLSLNIKHLSVESAGSTWETSFADIDQAEPLIRRLVRLDDLTLCLDRADADGKIRFYQEPLLYRCQLDLRVMTRLMSANTRRATSLCVQMRSSKLAWGVTSEQLTLLLRLLRERTAEHSARSPPLAKPQAPSSSQALNATASNSAEPVRSESWSEWAWSWLPTWMDREGGVEEATIPSTPIPVFFAVFLDHVSLVLKVLETESGGRKRARGVLELFAEHVAARAASCAPTSLRVRFGVRALRLITRGRCVCGHLDPEQTPNNITVYMDKKDAVAEVEDWSWPAEILEDKVDAAEVAEEEDIPNRGEIPRTNPEAGQAESSEVPNEDHTPPTAEFKDDNLWHVMSPIIFLDFSHTRSPPSSVINPYDNPPVDFEFSDWGEDNRLKITVQPLEIRFTTGLLHRLSAFQASFKDLPQIPFPDIPMKTLTVEECEALYENLPQRRIDVNVFGLRIRLHPWDHIFTETELVLDVEVPHVRLGVSGPLYSHRVCSAACQMPKDDGPLWQGARLHVSCTLAPVEARLVSPTTLPAAPDTTSAATLVTNPTVASTASVAASDSSKTTVPDAPPGASPGAAPDAAPGAVPGSVLRFDLRVMLHVLLHPEMFARRDTVHTSYTIKIHEVIACGSTPRLWAAWLVLRSLMTRRVSLPLRCSQLAVDALADQDYVSIDATAMDLSMRGFITRHTQTHNLMLHSARVMAFYGPVENKLKQAWIFSAPDVPTSTSFLRVAGQFYGERFYDSLDYVGIWMEPLSICIDPLLIAWLAYRPQIRPLFDLPPEKSASVLSMRRRSAQPSSSGRGISRAGSGADMVHTARPRSASSSEPGERLPNVRQEPAQPSWSVLQPEQLLKLYERMQRVLLNVEVGMVLVYVCTSTASAVNCVSLQDAMERHAAVFSHVMAMRMGRLTLCSSDGMRSLWDEVRHDGPTFIKVGKGETMEKALKSFPWKMSIVDVSCYTVVARQIIDSGRERAFGLQSRLKNTDTVTIRTILESVTTTITLSVVTKSMHIRSWTKPQGQASKTAGISADEKKLKYFATGADFKPGSLKDFVRGPARREKETAIQVKYFFMHAMRRHIESDNGFYMEKGLLQIYFKPEPKNKKHEMTEVTKEGPVVSIGINLYADTPPIMVKLDQDQVHTVAATIHCLKHLEMLIRRAPQKFPRPTSTTGSRSIVRSVNEVTQEGTHSNPSFSESRSDLVPIFECYVQPEVKLKKFFWFQWVVGRATLVISSNKKKLAIEIDDIISTIDLQEHYNQLKVKIGSASIRHHKKNFEDEWTTGLLGGRVLEAREPTNAKEENHFLSVTITQAQISTLPESWKEELHPKLLEHNPGVDSLWEVFATLAPLEAVLQPAVLENIMTLIQEMAPPSFCPLQTETAESRSSFQWPFCYISAGGLRLLITTEASEEFVNDTFVVVVGRVSVNPHPENPICRQSITGGLEGNWPAAGGLGGRQFEITIYDFAVQSTLIDLIVEQEAIEISRIQSAGSENPAVKWTQPPVFSIVTPILYPVNVCCVLAPATYSGETLEGGPAMELNILTDCALELSMEQLQLAAVLAEHARAAASSSYESDITEDNPHGLCPYIARVIKQTQGPANDMDCATRKLNEEEAGNLGSGYTSAADSGVDMFMTKPRMALDMALKKNVAIAFNEERTEASDYIEVFVTMGTIELSLYVGDDGSPEIIALRPPGHKHVSQDLVIKSEDMLHLQTHHTVLKRNLSDQTRSRSLTEAVRDADMGHAKLKLNTFLDGKRFGSNLPLLHISLHQPNLYYWKKSSIRSLQVSLFDAWVGLGAAPMQEYWSKVIFSTAKGVPDPVTDIPPALATATVKIVRPSNGGASFMSTSCTTTKGSVIANVERPVLLEVSTDILQRLLHIIKLIGSKMRVTMLRFDTSETVKTPKSAPLLYTIRNMMVERFLESITIQVSQLGVSSSEGTVGWDSASLQVAAGLRPDQLVARALVSALLVAAGPPGKPRHVFLQPLMIGLELESFWEAWRRVEGGALAQEPTVRVGIDLDRVSIDARPGDLEALNRIHQKLDALLKLQPPKPPAPVTPPDITENVVKARFINASPRDTRIFYHRGSGMESYSAESCELDDQFYKDDLKSGAFKLINGDQLPMTYQVILNANTVSWRYPQPRTVTKIMVFPIPGVDEEVKCVLEFYHFLLNRWEPHTYIQLPVLEPREIKLFVNPPDAIFAILWRFRAYADNEKEEPPFEFNIQKFTPRAEPLTQVIDRKPEPVVDVRGASAEELAGALRVDSYFAPRLLPRVRAALRFTQFELHVYNSLPRLPSQASELEGYYVSPPLLRSHRMLSVLASDAALHAMLGSSAGSLLLLDAALSCDVLECATGMLEQAAAAKQLRVALSGPAQQKPRARVSCDTVHVALHVPRLRTLNALANDWIPVLKKFQWYYKRVTDEQRAVPSVNYSSKRVLAYATAAALDGRVSLWVHNSCSSELRVGQEGTDEQVLLAPGARLAYRWRSPNAPLNLRFALAGPTPDYHWSHGIPFTGGAYRVRLENAESLGSTQKPGGGVFLHARVDAGPHRRLTLAGRLVLANVLRRPLLYKVRARCAEAKAWRSVASGELEPETVGRSVLCGADCDIVLKIKFGAQESGWSGDIPLKECPKENVPWLVKVPEKGGIAYMSVWCRVVRARIDNRLLAAIWPLYMLYSHLPLDTDVLVVTQTELSTADMVADAARPSPLVQASPGRGACTHLLAPGTTAARHQLSFQYRELECPVTREAIPLHYGVTDTSVFDKRAPVNKIEEVIEDIRAWFERSRQEATSGWPYSIVKSHWNAEWGPASSQPRCDVTVRYGAVRAGGGCSLLIQLCPVVLLCNAAPMPLTLRAHDAAPLCKLDQGTAISAPSAVLKKPFFLSTEVARDTFVSNQLQVWAEEPGLYGSPPPGCVALDRSAPFAINCHQQVALLTLYYEIKEEINILGVTSTYVLINRLNTNLLVSTIAVPLEINIPTMLRPKSFKLVRPTKGGSLAGEPLSRFLMAGRWRSGDPSELGAFLCLALPAEEGSAPLAPAPVRLGAAPPRRALNLICEGTSVCHTRATKRKMPVVVLQQKHESRWLITVAPDPCPQFVVHNHTGLRLAVAEVRMRDDHAASLPSALPAHVQTVEECLGAHWWYVIEAGAVGHYSTPSYCARFPPIGTTQLQVGAPVLTFGEAAGMDVEPEWSAGVAVEGGEQLLQLPSGVTVKLRVRAYPHSSLLELQKVAQNDISASDIRRRLQGPFLSQDSFFRAKVPSALNIDTVADMARVSITGPRIIRCDDMLNEPIVKIIGADNAILTQIQPDKLTVIDAPLAESLAQNAATAPEPSVSNEKKEDANLMKENHTVGPEPAIDQGPTVAPEITVEAPTVLVFQGGSSVQSGQVNTLEAKAKSEEKIAAHLSNPTSAPDRSLPAYSFLDVGDSEWTSNDAMLLTERLRCVIGVIVIEMGVTPDISPLFALHIDRAAVLIQHDSKGTKTILSIADVQVDNLQFSSGQFDFGVVASTRAAPLAREAAPPIWSAFAARTVFGTRHATARLLLRLRHDSWRVVDNIFHELTEVELSVGPLALYVEDSYVAALTHLVRAAQTAGPPAAPAALAVADTRALQCPLRLRLLNVHPLDLTLTLHTAVRMYIALDQSPLRLSAFQLRDMMTSAERLTHALTVHYLSAAILGAGWVVGGLELLGAPGALAARVGGATGGVRGVATATAAALLRSLSAWAGSLARNLDLLAGDEEHARRAAAARRRAPHSLIEGLAAGITNFAINILGAVGGLAHHPLVGVAVGESPSGAAALRRGLLGALAKPLSATADLVAFAGTGLLHQTGWDPVPQPRAAVEASEAGAGAGASWRRDSVRWAFRLVELSALAGFDVLLDGAPLRLVLSHKYLVVADAESERIVEMIDLRYCSLGPYQGVIIELMVAQSQPKHKVFEARAVDEDEEYQVNAAAMARVARYTGADGAAPAADTARVLALLPPPRHAAALYAALCAAVHNNADTHHHLL